MAMGQELAFLPAIAMRRASRPQAAGSKPSLKFFRKGEGPNEGGAQSVATSRGSPKNT